MNPPPVLPAVPGVLAPAAIATALSLTLTGLPPAPADAPHPGTSAFGTSALSTSAFGPSAFSTVQAGPTAALATATQATTAPARPAPVQGETTHRIPGTGVAPGAAYEAALAGLDADQRSRLAVLTAPVTDTPFTVAAAAWRSGEGGRIESVQIRLHQNGVWSPWQDLTRTVLDEAGPAGRTGTDPLVAFGADGAQLRVVTEDGTAPAGMELSLIDPGTAPTDAEAAQAAAHTPAPALPTGRTVVAQVPVQGSEPMPVQAHTVASRRSAAEARRRILPNVVTRAQWGANEAWASDSPRFGRVKALTIHHTAGTNGYTRAQAVQQMRGIYAYYTRTLEWGDFPYHLVTDRFGTIYEGRRGALESTPLGTHAGGFNTGTVGISTLGNYETAVPSEAVVDAMARATAFYLYRDGLDAHGRTTLVSAGNAKFQKGRRVTLDVVHPHRATSFTACPGRHLTARLGDIRTRAARIAAQAERTTPAPRRAVPRHAASAPAKPQQKAAPQRVAVAPKHAAPQRTAPQRTAPRPAPKRAATARPAPKRAAPARPALQRAAPKHAAPGVRGGARYTVRPNDGWWLVAERTGVPMRTLQSLNGMGPRTMLHPGMVLRTR
ncbi:N-acetylmuramoyl-L-alanine amidase [Micrococcus sp.]|uniref:N-acetylmuramoyl-L-alanine amidase n=1 Tax=Micrococcus sp. TaxID=1271 RepID=UPI002A9180CD|nr:N-acetylmuramoyl-L-alanine amidase [Micrococcus sp.]MDY6054940.1 N-acetylmuramoyl-L-alanine amidase [Micrococcus sp.]